MGVKGSTEKSSITSHTHWAIWGQHLAIAAAYAGVYELCRFVSVPQWMLMNGFRLTCLLLLPTRYWPAIVLGEALPLIENAIAWGPKFGLAWGIIAAIPMALMWIPVLMWMRRRWQTHDTEGRPRIGAILAANLVTALINAASTTFSLMLALHHRPGEWPEIVPSHYFFAYLLGAFLGSLTLLPAMLALYGRFRGLEGRPLSVAIVWRSSLMQDVLWWVLPAMVALAWVAVMTSSNELRQAIRLAMLWPVFGLAWRHRFAGAAIGGLAASVALATTAQAFLDPQMVQIQVTLSIALSATLLWTARRESARAILPERS